MEITNDEIYPSKLLGIPAPPTMITCLYVLAEVADFDLNPEDPALLEMAEAFATRLNKTFSGHTAGSPPHTFNIHTLPHQPPFAPQSKGSIDGLWVGLSSPPLSYCHTLPSTQEEAGHLHQQLHKYAAGFTEFLAKVEKKFPASVRFTKPQCLSVISLPPEHFTVGEDGSPMLPPAIQTAVTYLETAGFMIEIPASELDLHEESLEKIL